MEAVQIAPGGVVTHERFNPLRGQQSFAVGLRHITPVRNEAGVRMNAIPQDEGGEVVHDNQILHALRNVQCQPARNERTAIMSRHGKGSDIQRIKHRKAVQRHFVF